MFYKTVQEIEYNFFYAQQARYVKYQTGTTVFYRDIQTSRAEFKIRRAAKYS